MLAYFSSFNDAHAEERGADFAAWCIGMLGAEANEKVCASRFWVGLPNVWLGVSVENQKAGDERIPLLLKTPAAVRFLSVEPMLGAIDVDGWFIERDLQCSSFVQNLCSERGYCLCGGHESDPCHHGPAGLIDWVICGGESGPGARPMHPDWARSLRDQCVAAGVPFFFKQWGEWTPGENVDAHSGTVRTAHWFDQRWSFNSEDLACDEGHVDDEPELYRVGKKAAGDLLDGVQWHQFPEVAR